MIFRNEPVIGNLRSEIKDVNTNHHTHVIKVNHHSIIDLLCLLNPVIRKPDVGYFSIVIDAQVRLNSSHHQLPSMQLTSQHTDPWASGAT